MKYLFVGGFNLPNRNAAAQRIMAIAEVLVSYGHSVDIAGLSKELDEYSEFVEIKKGIRIINTPYPKSKKEWLLYLLTPQRLLKVTKLTNYDILVCYNHPAFALIWLSISRLFNRFALISDLTEWYSTEHGGPLFRVLKKLDVSVRMYLSSYLSDRLVVASQYLCDFYKNKPVLILPTLVPGSECNTAVDYSATGSGRLRFIYAGLPFYKGDNDKIVMKDRIDLIVESFLKIKKLDWELNIYGVDEEEYCALLKKKREKMFGDRINFHGKVPRAIVMAGYCSSHYSIFFRDENRSNKAGFPTKLSESFEVGVPVITNDVGDSKEYVGTDRGFIFPNSADEYSEYITEIITLGVEHSIKLKCNVVENNPLAVELWSARINEFMTKGL